MHVYPDPQPPLPTAHSFMSTQSGAAPSRSCTAMNGEVEGWGCIRRRGARACTRQGTHLAGDQRAVATSSIVGRALFYVLTGVGRSQLVYATLESTAAAIAIVDPALVHVSALEAIATVSARQSVSPQKEERDLAAHPLIHWHRKDPGVLTQSACGEQPVLARLHSSTSLHWRPVPV